MNNVQEVSSIEDGLSEWFVKYQVRVQVLPHEMVTICADKVGNVPPE
jgi:hypothetical protein